ncbi:hypothetical protein MCHI_003198 [Candidatus Magnetoovum chiemensis]|nr:hypothetical protein MCHI_003198 [Candidatus Magnetoovum chiemensis]
MKVVYILKETPNATGQKLIDAQKKLADVTVIDMKNDKDYSRIIDLVVSSDKVITY